MKPLISLDVFDTAIFRKVFYPTDIFNVVEDKVGNNFKALRVEAQRNAGRKVPYCSILDIYKEIRFPFNPKEEIKAEYENCVANPYILDMYNKGEADYIFISDMYLPATVIKSMLEKCGYKNPQVYVSCELKAMKADGGLFKKVKNTLHREIIKHIGDNYNADILGAKRAGIKEVEYIGPPVYNKKVVTPLLKNVKLRKLLIDEELSNASIAEKVGYQFAPLALAFTQQVLDEAKEGQTVFFNARDSYIFYIIARWILKTKKKIKYCRFSRKSCLLSDILTNYSLLHPYNAGSLHFFKIQRVENLRDFFKDFGIERVEIPNTLQKNGLTLDTSIEMNPRKIHIISEAALEAQSFIYKKVKENRQNFLKYIQILGMKNNDIFVDLGYAGTIQGIIKRITKINLKGMYVNTYSKGPGNYMGTVFERNSFFSQDMVGYHGAVIEAIYSEPKGTVIGYDDCGKPCFLADRKCRKEATREILRGLLKGVKELLNEKIFASASDCALILRRYINTPTLEEATFGNNIIFENGSLENESIVWFNKDWIKRGRLRECYNRSYWKEAFKLLMENDLDYNVLIKEIK